MKPERLTLGVIAVFLSGISALHIAHLIFRPLASRLGFAEPLWYTLLAIACPLFFAAWIYITLKSSGKGFTLIELVMVIAIIGILSAVAIPLYANLTNETKIAATKGALSSIRAAVTISYANSATSGEAFFPAQITESLFSNGRVPKNSLTNSSVVNNVADTVSGTATGSDGWWYVTDGSNAGYVGAYADGVIATDSSEW